MCGIVLAVFLLPLLGAVAGYALFGAAGAWIGGLAGLGLAIFLGVAPLAMLANAERRKLARERIEHPEDAMND
jgi:hypothetical protein